MSLPHHDYWIRCKACDHLYLNRYTPSKLQKNQYATSGCAVCHHRWLEETTVNSMYRFLKKGFILVKKGKIEDWEELAPVLFGIYRNSDPIFVRSCYKKAFCRFENFFIRKWEQSLRSQE